jgi:hypothetical protein
MPVGGRLLPPSRGVTAAPPKSEGEPHSSGQVWRGYAQPRPEAGRSARAAALVLGVIGDGWHLPLMLAGPLPWSELLVIPALYIVWAWAYNSDVRPNMRGAQRAMVR